MYFLKTRLWYVIIRLYIKTQREVQILPVLLICTITLLLQIYMALGCISPLFVQSLIYVSYSNDWGGDYVVKTYPSIDPIAAPLI